jgi:hypothetical protein
MPAWSPKPTAPLPPPPPWQSPNETDVLVKVSEVGPIKVTAGTTVSSNNDVGFEAAGNLVNPLGHGEVR